MKKIEVLRKVTIIIVLWYLIDKRNFVHYLIEKIRGYIKSEKLYQLSSGDWYENASSFSSLVRINVACISTDPRPSRVGANESRGSEDSSSSSEKLKGGFNSSVTFVRVTY